MLFICSLTVCNCICGQLSHSTRYNVSNCIKMRCVLLSFSFWRNFFFSLSTVGCVVCWVVLSVQVVTNRRGIKKIIDKNNKTMPEQQRCELIWKMKVYAFFLSNPYTTIYIHSIYIFYMLYQKWYTDMYQKWYTDR